MISLFILEYVRWSWLPNFIIFHVLFSYLIKLMGRVCLNKVQVFLSFILFSYRFEAFNCYSWWTWMGSFSSCLLEIYNCLSKNLHWTSVSINIKSNSSGGQSLKEAFWGIFLATLGILTSATFMSCLCSKRSWRSFRVMLLIIIAC